MKTIVKDNYRLIKQLEWIQWKDKCKTVVTLSAVTGMVFMLMKVYKNGNSTGEKNDTIVNINQCPSTINKPNMAPINDTCPYTNNLVHKIIDFIYK